MKRPLALLALGAVGLALAGTAAAKGPRTVTITGPGLAEPVVLRGDAEGDTTSRIGRLVEFGGWFQQAFHQTPDPTTRQAPTRKLGPRYLAMWTVPLGGSRSILIRQAFYPWAAGGPVTYMRPGQRIFGSLTRGGWYRGSLVLRAELVRLGIPNRRPLPA